MSNSLVSHRNAHAWRRRSLSLLLFCFVGATATSVFAAPWKQVKDKSGIKVSSRNVPNSGLKEVRGIATMDTTLQSLVALMNDTGASPKWIHNCKRAKLIKKYSTAERMTYTVIDAPWPLDDRDIYVHSRISYDRQKGRIDIKLTGKEKFAPKHDGRVRVRALKGFWTFTEIGAGKVQVVYQIYNDPQAPMSSAANGELEKSVFETVKSMRSMVQKSPYKGYQFSEQMISDIAIN